MRIATTYDDGKIFQHFGRTEFFKIYEVEGDRILSSEVISSNGAGHGALAGVLADNNVNVLICGGCGAGAQTALSEAGIEVITGAQGEADLAVVAFMRGELESAGVNCDHHGEDHECGHSEGGCGGGCGGCHGGSCGPKIEGPNVNKMCKVHYLGTFEDGTKFDSSYDRGEPIGFVCGAGMMIAGFDKAVATMEVGQTIDVTIPPEEAYGVHNPEAVITVALAELQGSEELNVGQSIYLSNGVQQFPVVVTEKTAETITLDANHELAGKTLNFKIELVSVED